MPIRKAVLSLAVLLLATVSLALAQGTYTQIDYPGALVTSAYAIDSAGDIVGSFFDSNGNNMGFLLKAGTFTTINYPGSAVTYLTGINDENQIVGIADNPNVGFLYDTSTQEFTILDRPGSIATYPDGINNAGTIVGSFSYGKGQHQGFELVNSNYKIISPPAGMNPYVFGITSTGTLFVTSYNNAGGLLFFTYSQGKYSRFTIPNAPGFQVLGVNPSGTTLVGAYIPSTGVTAGFTYEKKTLTTLQFPGSSFTQAFGINATGEVAGQFVDSKGNIHGYTWTPPADAAKR